MMKKCILFLLCLLLCGCGQKDAETVEIDGVTGIYEGSEAEGLPEGEGTFTAGDGWTYEGSFSAGSFAAGRVSSYPMPDWEGSYTGEVTALVPEGQGELRWEGGSFTGSFEAGLPHTGEAENLPCSVYFGEACTEGLYTGPVSAALPQGEGSFSAEGGRNISYTGGFEEGRAAGEGSLTDDGFLLEGQRGRYEGSVLDGIPQGEGSFSGRSTENIDFCYTGQWEAGLFHGEGELIYDSELYYERRGRFSQGAFDPEPFELLAALGSREPYFSLNDAQKAYISEYPELLDTGRSVPHYMEADYRFLRENNFNYANYVEDPSLHDECWMLFYNYIILQSRTVDIFGPDNSCTVILACNTVYKEPAVFYLFGDCGNLAELRYVTAYGIPMGMTHYTSATGEKIEAVAALLGSAGGY